MTNCRRMIVILTYTSLHSPWLLRSSMTTTGGTCIYVYYDINNNIELLRWFIATHRELFLLRVRVSFLLKVKNSLKKFTSRLPKSPRLFCQFSLGKFILFPEIDAFYNKKRTLENYFTSQQNLPMGNYQ